MEKPDDLILIIIGATGDLASRKLFPAIYSLKNQNLMPERFAVLGVGRTELISDDFRKKVTDAIITFSEENINDHKDAEEFAKHCHYCSSDLKTPESYKKIFNAIEEIRKETPVAGNMIFYMATPPLSYESIAVNLASTGLASQSEGFRRFIVEKPFGYDLESALQLNSKLHSIITEDQIFRMDHYLGKETVQNLLVTRFSNGIFEPLWNRNYVQRVEITSAESIGVEGRGAYYDKAGALRDMVQNHLLQMVGITAMEPPSSLGADAIRNEVLKVFQSLQPIKEENVDSQVIRGQYTASRIKGQCVPGYREEKGVDKRSRTETYVAMKFFINNWRWGGVPFYIRTGKKLPTRVTEIVIHFKATPHHLFQTGTAMLSGNQLVVRIQPDEGILLKFDMKEPGSGFSVKNVNMDFHYKELANTRLPSAYERLLYDVMLGDQTLFSRDDEVETAWKFIDPVLNAWKDNPAIKVYGYAAGTWGPEPSNSLIEGDGLTWRYPCRNLADEEIYCEL